MGEKQQLTFKNVYAELEPARIFVEPMKGQPKRQKISFETTDGHMIVVILIEHQVYDIQDKLGRA